MPDTPLLVCLLRLALKDRAQLVFVNAALRQQLAVYKRSVKRPNIKRLDPMIEGPASILDEKEK